MILGQLYNGCFTCGISIEPTGLRIKTDIYRIIEKLSIRIVLTINWSSLRVCFVTGSTMTSDLLCVFVSCVPVQNLA